MTGPDISIIEDARALSRNLGINVAHIVEQRDDAQRECEAWKQRALKAEALVHELRMREARNESN